MLPYGFWCALQSLTLEDWGSVCSGQGEIAWQPMSESRQRHLLALHQGAPVKGPSNAVAALAACLAPGLRDPLLLERCLQACFQCLPVLRRFRAAEVRHFSWLR